MHLTQCTCTTLFKNFKNVAKRFLVIDTGVTVQNTIVFIIIFTNLSAFQTLRVRVTHLKYWKSHCAKYIKIIQGFHTSTHT